MASPRFPLQRNAQPFLQQPDSRNAAIERVLDEVRPMRLCDIARAINHDAALLSGHIRSLLYQGRIKKVAHGQYVRVPQPAPVPQARVG